MNNLKSEVRNYILNRRTISYANVCIHFNSTSNTLKKIIEEMELKEEIRINTSACSLNCSSCSTCNDKNKNRIQPTSILVSIKRLF